MASKPKPKPAKRVKAKPRAGSPFTGKPRLDGEAVQTLEQIAAALDGDGRSADDKRMGRRLRDVAMILGRK